jgi:2-deoxy-D-gluconate 3-dehydrogenase
MMDLELDGKVAIVTGASRGLGRAMAVALADQGAFVLAAARSAGDLSELESKYPGRIKGRPCDMRDLAAVGALADEAVGAFGRLDIVVNNAGIAPAGSFLDQAESVWHEVFTVNVAAPATLARAAGRHMVPQRSGKIINIASTSGILGKPTLVAYSASKGALVQFTKALAAEWAPAGVQVNAIAPGAFETDAQAVLYTSSELMTRRLRKIPAGRMGHVDEIGPLICWLSSSLSDFVTGSIVVIDGGESSKL